MKTVLPDNARTEEIKIETPITHRLSKTKWFKVVITSDEVLSRWTAIASEPALNRIWDNADEDAAWASL